MNYTISAGTVTLRLSRDIPELLLIQAGKNTEDWSFPKGHVQAYESLEAAAIRETLEETGIDVEIHRYLCHIDVRYPKENKVVHFFVATCQDERQPIPQLEEVNQAQWFPITNLPKITSKQSKVLTMITNLTIDGRSIFGR